MTRDARILILFSNPGSSSRLRLDQEYRALDEVLRRKRIDTSNIRRLEAVRREDFFNAIHENEYDIIQFSGHGQRDGFILEDDNGRDHLLLSPPRLAALLKEASPRLRAAIFLSCYSAEALPYLTQCAPYIVSLQGEVGDRAAILFGSTFYSHFLESGSIEGAFVSAQTSLQFYGLDGDAKPILTRRGGTGPTQHVLVQSFPLPRSDSILINIGEAEKDISSLGVPLDEVLSMLGRKLRVHKWIFNTSRDRAIIPLGPFFGIFSWANASDAIICHRLMRVRNDASDAVCEAWGRLVVQYNDFKSLRHRGSLKPSDDEDSLADAMRHARLMATTFLSDNNTSQTLRTFVPFPYRMTKTYFNAYLEAAERCDADGRSDELAVHIEQALSTLHDLVNAVTTAIAATRPQLG